MVKEISEGMSKLVIETSYVDKGVKLENLLTNICRDLGQVGILTDNNADVDFLLSVVGSYLMAKHKDAVDSTTKPPSYIFNTSLFPMLENMELEIEEIEDGE